VSAGKILLPNKMTSTTSKTPLRTAALIAGFGLLLMVITAPYSELFVYPKLVVPVKADQTIKNIISNKSLFISCIFGYLITFICDVVVAWALYVLLKPVREHLSLLTAWFRLVYAVIALVALLNLVTILRLANTFYYLSIPEQNNLYNQVGFSLNAFRDYWSFGILFFGIHLLLLAYLVWMSGFIPRILGALLAISGIGYLLNTLRTYLFPNLNVDFAVYNFFLVN
jgi:Domain of unknown function (DUF4386)